MSTRNRTRARRGGADRIPGPAQAVGLIAVVMCVTSCAALRSDGGRPSTGAMRESALEYLAEGDPTVDRVQPLAAHVQVEAGESSRLPRATPTAPPQVSHELASLLPITLEENACLACHLPSNAGEDDVPIPESHFERPRVEVALSRSDPRFADRAMLSYVAGYTLEPEDPIGARYNCVQCHTASVEKPDELGNRP